MIIRCQVCQADPLGRWKQPPACIFVVDQRRTGASRYACRDHLPPQRKETLENWEQRNWPVR
jgi:hypothetical protein